MKNKQDRLRKTIASMLVITMLMSIVPNYVFADDSDILDNNQMIFKNENLFLKNNENTSSQGIDVMPIIGKETESLSDDLEEADDIDSNATADVFKGNDRLNAIENLEEKPLLKDKSQGVSLMSLSVDTVRVGDYDFSPSTGSITWYYGIDTEVVIPKQINDIDVRSIGEYAFYNMTEITKIEIPDTVISIGDSAFQNCEALTDVVLGNGVITIGNNAFQNCYALKKINIPNTMKTISSFAFYNCSSLESFKIPNSVTELGGYAFYNCTSLSEVVLSNNLSIISSCLFFNCTSLNNVLIPDKVKSIDNWAFYNCSNITNAVVPGDTVSIGDNAFSGCVNLENIMIPESVGKIGADAFELCEKVVICTLHGTAAEEYAISNGIQINYNFNNMTNLEIVLPDCDFDGQYENMTIVLTNTRTEKVLQVKTNSSLRYQIGGLQIGNTYNVELINKYNNVLGRIENITIGEENNKAIFESLKKTRNIYLSIKDENGSNITYKTTVKWYTEEGNYLSQGNSVSGVLVGTVLNYAIELNDDTAKEYYTPQKQEILIDENTGNIDYTLQRIGKSVVSGKVIDAEINEPMPDAVVSINQKISDKYSDSSSAVTDTEGNFSIESYNVSSNITVSKANYVTLDISKDISDDVNLGDLKMEKISGGVLNMDITYSDAAKESENKQTLSSYDKNDLKITVLNQTKNKIISKYSVQLPKIILLEEAEKDDLIKVTIESYSGKFAPCVGLGTLDDKLKTNIKTDIVANGYIKANYANSSNANTVAVIYDKKGIYKGKYMYLNNSITTTPLEEGNYTIVSIGESEYFNKIKKLSELETLGLIEGEDYVKTNVEVKNGIISEINAGDVPLFDESKLYYTDSEKTIFSVNKTKASVGTYFTLRAQIGFKEEYEGKISNLKLIVDIDDDNAFVPNSVLVGTSAGSYSIDGRSITIDVDDASDLVRFCVVPTIGGDYSATAYIKFELDGSTITQPIGNINYTAEDMTINAPDITSQKFVSITGTALANSDITVYDNDVIVGTAKANKSGTWKLKFDFVNPGDYSEHTIFAEVLSPVGISAYTQRIKVVYNKDHTQVSKVTAIYNGNEMVFDFINPSSVTSSYSVVGDELPFTFLAEFTNENPELITSASIETRDSSGRIVTIPLTYDPFSKKWIGTNTYTQSDMPTSINVIYENKSINVDKTGISHSEWEREVPDRSYTPKNNDIEYTPPSEDMTFGLTDIYPKKSSNGRITIKLTGNLLEANLKAKLYNGQASYDDVDMYWFNHQKAYVTFDLSDAPDGQYNLEIVCNKKKYVFDNCFSVDSSLEKGNAEINLNIDGNVSVLKEYNGSFTVKNTGHTDIWAPVVYFDGQNMSFKLNKDDEFETGGTFFISNHEGLAGVIAPGETANLNFIYRADDVAVYRLYTYNYEERPENIIELTPIDDESNAMEITQSNLVKLSGKSGKEYAINVAKMASYMQSLGETEFSPDDLDFVNLLNGKNILTGSTVASSTDLSSIELSVGRTYSADIEMHHTIGKFGYGWDDGFAMIAEHIETEDDDGNPVDGIAIIRPSQNIIYVKNDDGKYIEPLAGKSTAELLEDGKIKINFEDDSYLIFAKDGLLYRGYDIHGNYIEYSYDEGKLSKITSSNGDSISLYYEDDKVKSVASDITGDTVFYEYTGDYLTSVRTKYGTVSYTYDTRSIGGRKNCLTKAESDSGAFTEITYDDNGRIIEIRDNSGFTSYEYGDKNDVLISNSEGNTSHVYYNEMGLVVRTIDAAGNVISYEYDENNDVVIDAKVGLFSSAQYEYDDNLRVTGIIDAAGNKTGYTYDKFGNISSITDARNIITKYNRDDKGQTTSIEYADASKEQYEYDENGNLTKATNRNGSTVSYEYDSFNRVTKERYSTGDIREYTYDSKGNTTSIKENDKLTSIEYNTNGDMTKVIYPDGKTVSYAYDSYGRMISVTDNEGAVTGYVYDSASNLISVTLNGNNVVSYSYNSDGSIKKQTNANGTYTQYEYVNGELSKISNCKANGEIMSSFEYTYNENGYIDTMTDIDGVWKYVYDKTGQLIKATSPAGEVTEYEYDLSGNRISKSVNGEKTTYTSNELNQYTVIGGSARSYDVNGNLISQSGADKNESYEYDYLDRLVKFISSDGTVYEYGYDAFGGRNKVSVNGVVTEYLNSPTGYVDVMASYNGENVTKYIQAAGLAAQTVGSDIYFYNFNHLGSTTEMTDKDGSIVNSYKYDVEGKTIFSNETINNPFKYVGQYGIINDENGLIYDRARYVSADTMSFINVDPLGQNYDLNVYRYAGNNIVNNIDISGAATATVTATGIGTIKAPVTNPITNGSSSGGGGGPRGPASTGGTSGGASNGGFNWNGVGKVSSGVGNAIGIGAGTFNAYNNEAPIGKTTLNLLAGSLGAIYGGAAGGVAGGVAGGIIGFGLGGIGGAIGGITAGIGIGGIAGGIAGGKIGGTISDWLYDRLIGSYAYWIFYHSVIEEYTYKEKICTNCGYTEKVDGKYKKYDRIIRREFVKPEKTTKVFTDIIIKHEYEYYQLPLECVGKIYVSHCDKCPPDSCFWSGSCVYNNPNCTATEPCGCKDCILCGYEPPEPPGGGFMQPVLPKVDPSGYVYEAVASNRLEGVTTTVYYLDEQEDMWGEIHEVETVWEAEEYGQANPLVTDEEGRYAWDVPEGRWKVIYEKEGYVTTDSTDDKNAVNGWLPVPPPQVDVNVGMVSYEQPVVTNVNTYSDKVEISFSKYMDLECLNIDNIKVCANGEQVTGHIEFLDAEKSPKNETVFYASKIRFVPDSEFETTDSIDVKVLSNVKSYANVYMAENYQTNQEVKSEPKKMIAEDISVDYGRVENIFVTLEPKEAVSGKTLTAVSASPSVASVEDSVIVDADGNAIIPVRGKLPGSATIKLSLDGTDLKTEVKAIVLMGNTPPEEPQEKLENVTASYETQSILPKDTAVTLTSSDNADIYYTLDLTDPTDTTNPSRKKYDGAIALTDDCTIKAYAVKDGMISSDISEFEYSVFIYGDIYTDGKVNSADAIKLAQKLARWSVSFTPKELLAADVYKDDSINSADAIKLAQKLARWNVELGTR